MADMQPIPVVEKGGDSVYIIMMLPGTKGMVMNKKNRAKTISDELALNNSKSRAENGDPQAQFDFGMYDAASFES